METDLLQSELEKRLYHLKTLLDASRELQQITTVDKILRNFLLMTMGNFGTGKGFVLLQDVETREVVELTHMGFSDAHPHHLTDWGKHRLASWDGETHRLDPVEGNPDEPPDDISCILPFTVDGDLVGVLGLGRKLIDEPYSEDDGELLATLTNNLAISLRNARSFEEIRGLNAALSEKNVQLEQTLNELDRRVYHLKTLYDVSKDIFGKVDLESIVKHFLLMTLGNFGSLKGFITIQEQPDKRTRCFESIGYDENSPKGLPPDEHRFLQRAVQEAQLENGTVVVLDGSLPEGLGCATAFGVDETCFGVMACGPRLTEEVYTVDDQELLTTLVNSLAVALKNARSFEEIQRLNADLRSALRKVELLESIKANLCKFVPTTVTRLIEKSPTEEVLDSSEKDISVLFLDIEGYTKITERIGATAVNQLIERYFSVFMEAVYENNGDVVESSGDGLMVLFLSEDEQTHAMEAVRAARMIRENTLRINRESTDGSEPVIVNIGICSGPAFVGAAKFESLTGSRWVYTSHGNTTNVAARICSAAKGGQVLVSKSTAERVADRVSCCSLGRFQLKNVTEGVEVFTLD